MNIPKNAFLLSTILCGLSTSAHAQAYYESQPGTAAANYQPYYVAQAPAPENYAPPQTTTSTSSSASSYGSSSAFFAPSGERIVSDPLYLPLKGQIYGTTGYGFNTNGYKTYNSAGVESGKSFSFSDGLTQTLAYGVTDDVTLRLEEEFLVSGTNTDHQITGTTSQTNANGFTNPNFGVTYRAVDQRHNEPVDLDFSLDYMPNMISASSAGGGHDGAEAAGRQSVSFSSGLGREMRGFTIEGLAGATYNGKKTYTYLATDDTGTNSDFWNYYVALDTQTRITDRFSINGNIRYNDFDNYNAANQTTGETWIAQNANYIDFTVALNYHFIPNRLVGQLSYDNYLYTTHATSDDHTTPTSNSTTDEFGNNIFGVKLLYTFE